MAGSGELTKRSDGTWAFVVRSSTGETVATDAGEGFATQAEARLVLQTLLGGGYDGPIVSEATITCGQEITEDVTLESDLVCTSGPALVIAADNITVDLGGFTVSGEGPEAATAPGIVFRNVKGCTLQKGTVTGFGAGVAVNGGSNNVVQNVACRDNLGSQGSDFGDGIVVNDSSGNRIEGNTVARNGPFSGISLVGACSENEISRNVIVDTMFPGDPGASRQAMGIRVEGPAADNNTIVGNTVTGSGADGIAVLSTCLNPDAGCAGTPPNEGNVITANMSHGNGISGRGDGIHLPCVHQPVAASHTTITDNATNDNATHGICIDAVGDSNPGPTENRISGNIAHGNGEFDGFDGNTDPGCDSNVWENNDFGTVNQPCVRGAGAEGEQATIGPVELRVDLAGAAATVHVTYDINFSEQDVGMNQIYSEVCRIIGDDTEVGDTPAAGTDDTLGFLTPLFNDDTAPIGNSPTLSRHFMKTIRKQTLDEDRGPVPNPDEIRASVTLIPRAPATGQPIRAESNLVSLEI